MASREKNTLGRKENICEGSQTKRSLAHTRPVRPEQSKKKGKLEKIRMKSWAAAKIIHCRALSDVVRLNFIPRAMKSH